jgi:hypothetical protein
MPPKANAQTQRRAAQAASQPLEAKRQNAKYLDATYAVIADGEKVKCQMHFLSSYTDIQILDFWLTIDYLASYAKSVYSDTSQRDQWITENPDNLKKKGNATKTLKEMK